VADKAVTLSGQGEAYAAKGNVYYKAFQSCRSNDISTDDRVIATFAYDEFKKAEEKGFSKYMRSKNWLTDNEVLFGKPQWFMMNSQVKNRGFVKTSSPCYNWVTEKLNKQKGW
jgi:hypothetical protein